MNSNLHIFLSPCKHESRLLKETESLLPLFDHISIACVWEPGLKEIDEIDNKRVIYRIRLLSKRFGKSLPIQTIKYIEWVVRILFKFFRSKPKVVHCHSVSSLPVGVAFKILCGSAVVYDAHELETERNGLSGIKKKLTIVSESFFIKRYVDMTVVVSESIAEWYFKKYNIQNIVVVRNVPLQVATLLEKKNIFRKKFDIDEGSIVFIYQGVFSKGRSIDVLLDVFSRVNEDRHIVFMGYGQLYDKILVASKKHKNVHLVEAVSPDQIINYTACADVGICLIENTCLSYYYSLPNKFFEYILSGLPVITYNFPDQSKIIVKYDCGWVVNENACDAVNLINKLSKQAVEHKSNKAKIARKDFNWISEVKNMVTEYEKLY